MEEEKGFSVRKIVVSGVLAAIAILLGCTCRPSSAVLWEATAL